MKENININVTLQPGVLTIKNVKLILVYFNIHFGKLQRAWTNMQIMPEVNTKQKTVSHDMT